MTSSKTVNAIVVLLLLILVYIHWFIS